MKPISTALVIGITLLLGGCASLMDAASNRMADTLTQGILSQSDPETVRTGMPAYLLLVDGLIDGSPNNPDLLLAGSRLNASYASAFVDERERARRLSGKALGYARRAICIELSAVCASLDSHPSEFTEALGQGGRDDVAVMYGMAVAWAGWIQANSDDWNALADLPRLTSLLERCVTVDEMHDNGGAHVYLGVLALQLPPSLGGQPERGRIHFERAIEISNGNNLMINVLMAEHYARMIFDRELHDRLLRTVLDTPADAPGMTLVNTLARQRAVFLLAEADDYF